MWLWIFLTLFFLISVVTSTLLYFSLRRITQYENLISEPNNLDKGPTKYCIKFPKTTIQL